MIKKLTELENKVIGCWCTDNCHGEILIKLYRELHSQGEFVENLPTLQSEKIENKFHPHKKAKIDFGGKGWN